MCYGSLAVPPEPVIAFVLQTLTVFETDTNISICVELLVPTPVTATLQVIGGSATGIEYIKHGKHINST